MNIEEYKGVYVFAQQVDGVVGGIAFELVGEAKKLAKDLNEEVTAILIGSDIKGQADELGAYGADRVIVVDDPALKDYRTEPYTHAMASVIKKYKPEIVLIGATAIGRDLGPRLAARIHTGLTADCTILEMNEDTDLSQIRPAFGGNIMAHIKTPNHRPQMATVRYKIMNAPKRQEEAEGEIISCALAKEKLGSHVEVLDIVQKEKEQFIENADVLVVAGRGVKKPEDLANLQKLADLLGGQLACTRPVAEAGWLPAKCQIGLSGRTVRPKLIITCGVSGAVQFTAGMNHAENIFAINSDPKAPIFKTAHYCLVGDLYEILPQLIKKI